MRLTIAYDMGVDAALSRYKLARKKKSLGERVGFTTGGILGTSGLSSVLAYLGLRPSKEPPIDLPAHAAEMARAMGIQPPEIASNKQPVYDPRSNTVRVPAGTDEATLSHELGHAKNWNSIRKQRRGVAVQATRGLGMISGMPALLYAGLADDPSYMPALVHAGINLPTLADEIMATTHGTKFMSGKYGLGKGLLKSKGLAPALGTYLLHAGAPAALTALHKRWNEA